MALREVDEVARQASPDQPLADQVPLFVALGGGVKGRKGTVIPAVEDGRAVPLEALTARYAGGRPIRVPKAARPPCPDCGWKPVVEQRRSILAPVALNAHPLGCPSLRARLLGMSEGCVECKRRPWGPCEEHRERTLTCQREGCIWGPRHPSRWSYMRDAQRYCQRCWRAEGSAPYLPPRSDGAAPGA